MCGCFLIVYFLPLQAQQSQENNDFIKQNGHVSISEIQKQEHGSHMIKADDDLGFDPFHETQKALAELMENEIQIQQQRIFQQQQREREEQNRVQHQQGSVGIGPHHFNQVRDFLL